MAHCHFYICMPKDTLKYKDISILHHKVRGKGVM